MTLYLKVTDLRKGFGSIVLRLCGLTVSRRAIQMRSFSFRSRAALSEWAGNLMKSSIWQVNKLILPVWSGCVRCLATGCLASSRLSFVRSLVCSLYLWSNRPTFCLPQVLQVRALSINYIVEGAECLLSAEKNFFVFERCNFS